MRTCFLCPEDPGNPLSDIVALGRGWERMLRFQFGEHRKVIAETSDEFSAEKRLAQHLLRAGMQGVERRSEVSAVYR